MGPADPGMARDVLVAFATGVAAATVLAALHNALWKDAASGSADDADGSPSSEPQDAKVSCESAAVAAEESIGSMPSQPPSRPSSPTKPSLLKRRSSSEVIMKAVGNFRKLTIRRLSTMGTVENPMTYVERRYFVPPRNAVALCKEATGSRPWEVARQNWLLSAAAAGEHDRVKVHNRLWASYRLWVDENISLQEGRQDIFHNFCIARALGVPAPLGARWSGTEAGDLLTCLAAAGVLVRGCETGKEALEGFLQDSLECYNDRFRHAKQRTFAGLTREEEHAWCGAYDFVQLADPQLGMFACDAEWSQELTMLRLAVQHVNRLKPRFLLVSGDLTNAWPGDKTRDVVAAQSASFKEALRELDPSIPLVLQPGNHDGAARHPRRPEPPRPRPETEGAAPPPRPRPVMSSLCATAVSRAVQSGRTRAATTSSATCAGGATTTTRSGWAARSTSPSTPNSITYAPRVSPPCPSRCAPILSLPLLRSHAAPPLPPSRAQIACKNDEAREMRAEQDAWLEAQLHAARGSGAKHVVLLSHVAPFMGEEDESQGWFNWDPEPRRWLLDLAAQSGVKLWLSGHYHGNCVVRSRSGVEVVTTSSCGGVINWSKPPSQIATSAVFNFGECVSTPAVICDSFHAGLRIFRVGERAIEHRWLELASVPKTIDQVFHSRRAVSNAARVDFLGRMLDLPSDRGESGDDESSPILTRASRSRSVPV